MRLLPQGLLCVLIAVNITCVSLTFAQVPSPTLSYNVGVRRGSFTLTAQTMKSLLESGYTISSVNSRTILNNFEGSTSFYLSKSDSLYRCSEEPPAYSAVVCWVFDPTPALINGAAQVDAQVNVLIGKWTGTIINPTGSMTPVHLEFTANVMQWDLPNMPQSVPVTSYDIEHGQIRIGFVPQGMMNAYKKETTFKVVSADTIIWPDGPGGNVQLRRVGSSAN